MSDSVDTFAGQQERDLTMVASKALGRTLADPKNAFPWGDAPRGVAPGKVKRLSLYDTAGDKKTLPGNFGEFTSLVCLGVPLHLVPLLPAQLPASLRTLIVVSGGVPAAALPRTLELPKLDTIIADEVKLTFAAAQVPSLRRLTVQAAKPQMLEVVAQLPKLVWLDIGPIPDPKFFRSIAKLPVQRLFLKGGGLTNLDGLEALSKVTHLTVKRANKLVDVTAIGKLGSLVELSFDFCPQLGDVRFLAKMKSLKVVTFWSCSDRKKTIRKSLPVLVANTRLVVDSEFLDDLEDDDD